MTPSEAVTACEFWTTNVAETCAIGTTTKQEIGEVLGGTRYTRDRQTGTIGWSMKIDRWTIGEDIGRIENPIYTEIVAEIGRRSAS